MICEISAATRKIAFRRISNANYPRQFQISKDKEKKGEKGKRQIFFCAFTTQSIWDGAVQSRAENGKVENFNFGCSESI